MKSDSADLICLQREWWQDDRAEVVAQEEDSACQSEHPGPGIHSEEKVGKETRSCPLNLC
jgi:hypothetical protein